MKKGFGRFVIVTLTVIVGIIVIDVVTSRYMDAILPKINNQGSTGKTFFSLNEVNTPIVIIGSSRASHHYVTPMIADVLGKPAYNVGRDGCFFAYNCCILNSILDRYTPELIVWENSFESLYESDKESLVSLYPYYYNNKWINELIKDKTSWDETVKLNSGLYRYNSVFIRILMRYATRKSFVDNTIDGYEPLTPKKLAMPLKLEHSKKQDEELSQYNTDLFREVLERAKSKGVRIIVVNSPIYFITDKDDLSAKTMRQICHEVGVEFYDNTQIPKFLEHPDYFNDRTHLNDIGARYYTKLFLEQIVR